MELFCDECGTKLGDFDYNHRKPHPVYVPLCHFCSKQFEDIIDSLRDDIFNLENGRDD